METKRGAKMTAEVVDNLLRDGAVTIAAAVSESGIGRSRLYAMMGSGELPYSQVGGRRLIPRVALRRVLAAGLVLVDGDEAGN